MISVTVMRWRMYCASNVTYSLCLMLLIRKIEIIMIMLIIIIIIIIIIIKFFDQKFKTL